MYDIVGKKRWYFLFSALITVPGLIFVLLGGLKPTIDFTGGTVWQVRFASNPTPAAVHAELVVLGHPEATVRGIDNGFIQVRTNPVDILAPPTPAPVPSASAAATATGNASASASASTAATPSSTASSTPSASPSPTLSATPAV